MHQATGKSEHWRRRSQRCGQPGFALMLPSTAPCMNAPCVLVCCSAIRTGHLRRALGLAHARSFLAAASLRDARLCTAVGCGICCQSCTGACCTLQTTNFNSSGPARTLQHTQACSPKSRPASNDTRHAMMSTLAGVHRRRRCRASSDAMLVLLLRIGWDQLSTGGLGVCDCRGVVPRSRCRCKALFSALCRRAEQLPPAIEWECGHFLCVCEISGCSCFGTSSTITCISARATCCAQRPLALLVSNAPGSHASQDGATGGPAAALSLAAPLRLMHGRQ